MGMKINPVMKKFLVSSLFFLISQALFSQELIQIEPEKNTGSSLLNRNELEFVRKHPVLNVVSDGFWPPFEYFNDLNPEVTYSGININLLTKMAALYNMKLNFIRTESYDESIRLMEEGKADIITGYTDRIRNSSSISLTNGIYTVPLLVVSSTENYPQEGDTIYHGDLSPETLRYIKAIFPENSYTLIDVDNPVNIIDAFRSGKAKYIIIGQFEISFAENLPRYDAYTLHSNYTQSFGISKRLGKEALSIFNKAAAQFTYEDINLICYEVQIDSRFEQKEEADKKHNQFVLIMQLLVITLVLIGICTVILTVILKHKVHAIEYDDVTRLHTYNRFRRNVCRDLKKARPNEYLLLSLNIDGFSFINDSIGLENGNRLLREVAEFFIQNTTKNEKYCRFYADNFIFFIKNPGVFPLIEDRVYKLTEMPAAVKQFLPEHYKLTFSSSVYYITDPKNKDITGMINKVNLAMKHCRDTFLTHRTIEYTSEMEQENEWNREVTINMNRAMENREFEVYFQPKFRFDTECIVGAEALIRWNRPNEGLLLPGKFIPLFEHNGFIEKIDIYVFKKVCEFLDEWNRSGKGGKCPFPLTISFNLSRFHLYDPDLLHKLTSIVKKYKIEPCKIEVELTESILFDNQKRLIQVMTDLRSAGFSVSVDDFGSGYSSLNLLKDMPADVIKLDKEFLSNAHSNPKETIIIESVIEMARKLNMTTVAEGIENKKQSELLRNIGCDIAQGFYFAKPMPACEYMSLLKRYI